VLGFGLVVQSQALLIEQFTDNQIDSVPGLAAGDTAGYLYTYKDSKSFVYKQGTTTSLTATLLASSATYAAGGGLAVLFKTGATATNYYPYAGFGFDWQKAGGTTASPLKYPVDLSAHTALIFKYTSTKAIIVEWAQSDDPSPDDGSAFFCMLPVSTKLGYHTCDLVQSEDSTKGFKQPYWVTDTRTFDPSTAVSLKFVVKTAGVSANFTIYSIFADDTTKGWPETSSSAVTSSAVDLSSSSVVVPSSSSSSVVGAASDMIWIPSLINQIQHDELAGGYWYGYADAAGSFEPSDFTTVADSIPAILTPGASGFAAIGFDWLDNGDPAPDPKGALDISARSNLCFKYNSTAALILVLKQQDVADSCPQMVLTIPKSTTDSVAFFKLAGFKKENWTKAGCSVTAPNFTKQTGVHIQNKSTAAVSMNLKAVGFDNYCGTPNILVGYSSSVKASSSSVKVSSSSVKGSSSSVKASSSSALINSSSSALDPRCTQVLSGTTIWMLADDDTNGVLNYLESTHPCYQGTSAILSGSVETGLGIAKVTNSEITFSTVSAGVVSIEMFSITGRSLGVIYNGSVSAGVHSAHWKGMNVRQGMYLFRLTQGSQTRVMNAVLTRSAR